MTLLDVARQAMIELNACGARAALVGGLAVGARAAERTTRDADFVVAVDDDRAAERMTKELQARGYALDIGGGVMCPVARTGHLLALKILARTDRRPHDDVDIGALLTRIEPTELDRARQALTQIDSRGFARGKALGAELAQLRRWRP